MTKSTLKIVDNEAVDIGLQKEQRAKVAEALSKFLASSYVLYMKTLYYHWNVTGKQFHSLHNLFEQQYETLHEAGDNIAERIRALGHFTPGTFADFLKNTSISEDSALPNNVNMMVKNLLRDNETCSQEARKVHNIASEFQDEVTADMMIERMASHEEAAWMLRATLEE